MRILFLASFIGGLLLGVRIMIFGVERPRTEHPSGERTFRLSPAVFVAFAILFGIVGYILTQREIGTDVTRLVIAGGLGAVAAIVTARSVRKWWVVTPEHEHEDERYILQGHVARVTKSIVAGAAGEVAFEVGDDRTVLPALGVDDSSLIAGSDAVIDRIEDGIAYVESWVEVEKRL